ncbi:hypothetical protein [Paraburkholderia sp. RAU2J]|uniref:hypothetical protein n=1 Tax=Paraburkholderia sp. RAU2J TaxID=1938810 RepID=UPI00131537EB|nr:hypothetical protein [Paraburkholderia sp. RAU2J]
MNQLTTVGIDLAKDVFAICVLDAVDAVLHRRVLRREAFIRWAEQLSSCRAAMEACGSSHHWGRWFAARGHTPPAYSGGVRQAVQAGRQERCSRC